MSETKRLNIDEIKEKLSNPEYIEKMRLQHEQDEAKKQQTELNARLKNCNIPTIFNDACFSNWLTDTEERMKILTTARRYVSYVSNVRRIGAVLKGTTGTGKSRMAASIARELMERGKHVLFLMSLEIDSKIDKQAYTIEYLIIDDIGLADTDYATKTAIMKLIARRYYNGVVTIITTNNEGEELSKQINKAILFRIGSNAVTMDFSGIKNKRTEESKEIDNDFNNYEVAE